MRKLKPQKTLVEVMNPSYIRVMLHDNGSCKLFLLNPKKDVNRKGKRATFTIGDRSFVFAPEFMERRMKQNVLHYTPNCSLPFKFKDSEIEESHPELEFADSENLHDVLNWHFLESIFSGMGNTTFTFFIILSLVGGLIIGFFMRHFAGGG